MRDPSQQVISLLRLVSVLLAVIAVLVFALIVVTIVIARHNVTIL